MDRQSCLRHPRISGVPPPSSTDPHHRVSAKSNPSSTNPSAEPFPGSRRRAPRRRSCPVRSSPPRLPEQPATSSLSHCINSRGPTYPRAPSKEFSFGGDGGDHGMGGGGRGCGFSGDDEDCGFSRAGCRDGGSSGVCYPVAAGRVSRVLGEGDGGAGGSVGKSPAKAPEMLKKDVFGGGGYDEISKMIVGDSKMNDMDRGFVQRRILASEEVGKVGKVFSRQRWGKSVEISEEIGSQTSILGMTVQPVARSSRGRALVPPMRFRDSPSLTSRGLLLPVYVESYLCVVSLNILKITRK